MSPTSYQAAPPRGSDRKIADEDRSSTPRRTSPHARAHVAHSGRTGIARSPNDRAVRIATRLREAVQQLLARRAPCRTPRARCAPAARDRSSGGAPGRAASPPRAAASRRSHLQRRPPRLLRAAGRRAVLAALHRERGHADPDAVHDRALRPRHRSSCSREAGAAGAVRRPRLVRQSPNDRAGRDTPRPRRAAPRCAAAGCTSPRGPCATPSRS